LYILHGKQRPQILTNYILMNDSCKGIVDEAKLANPAQVTSAQFG